MKATEGAQKWPQTVEEADKIIERQEKMHAEKSNASPVVSGKNAASNPGGSTITEQTYAAAEGAGLKAA